MLTRTDEYPDESSVTIDSLATSPFDDQIKRMRYRCSECSFQPRPSKTVPSAFMEVVPLNGQDRVLCVLCAQSILLRRRPDGKRNHGNIFYCPTISQGKVSDLCRYIGLHITRNTELETSARNFVRAIKDELVPKVELVIPGYKNGDPFHFSDLMDNLKNPSEESGIDSLRYWPNPAVFNHIFKFWDAAAYVNSNLGMAS